VQGKTHQDSTQKGGAGFYNPFTSFPFTGSVRPVYPLSAQRTVPKSIAQPDYAKTGIPKSERRFLNSTKVDILDAKQQEAMRKVCMFGREVLDIIAAEVKPGVTTDYLDEVCHKACMERNVSMVCSIVNSSIANLGGSHTRPP
jgi:methionyl aminopeptidase